VLRHRKQQKRFAQSVLLFLALATTSPSWAKVPLSSANAVSCPAALPGLEENTRAARRTLLTTLDVWQDACVQRADYYALRGVLLLELGQAGQAAIALEKAILLDPELPGVQLDYAQALAELGHYRVAESLVREVSIRPDIQPGLRSWLEQQLAALDEADWRAAFVLESMFGYENNLNSATSARSLALTLPGGTVSVPLADSELPVSGLALRLRLLGEAVHPLGEGQELRLFGGVSAREGEASKTALRSVQAGAEYRRQLGQTVLEGAAAAQALWLGGARLFEEQELSVGVRQALPLSYPFLNHLQLERCEAAGSVIQSWQDYPNAVAGDATVQSLRLETLCASADGAETVVRLERGRNEAGSALRPGGDKTQWEIALRHERPWRAGDLSLWARYGESRDAEPYSVLLGNQRADTQRSELGVSYWQEIEKDWAVGIEALHSRQHSNVALFEQENQMIYLGMRWALD